MFRHFAQDPTASELMRIRAPAVFEWQARLWNAGTSEQVDPWLEGIPNDWSPILIEIAKAYLPFLNANAEAWAAGRNKLETTIQGVSYQRIPVSQYRVWCLEQLRSHFLELRDNDSREA